MNNLKSLKLCVEKSISKSDNKSVKETFGLPAEAFSSIPLPGVSFKKNTHIGEDIPGTYTRGSFIPLPELKYEYLENFTGASKGTDYGFSSSKGTEYGFSPSKGTDYGFSPSKGTDYGFSVLPGIQDYNEQELSEEEPPEEVIASFSIIKENQLKRLHIITVYLYSRFGTEVTKTIMQSPMLNKLKNQNLTTTPDRLGVQNMLDIVGAKVLGGYNIDSYDLGYVGPDYIGTVYMSNTDNPDFTQSWDYGLPIADFSQGVRGSLSIPTETVSSSSNYSNTPYNFYDFKKALSQEQLLEYQQQFEDIFDDISEEEDEYRKLISLEEYEPDNNENNIMFQRIKNFIDKGIIVLTHPELGIAQSIIRRKFVVKKITISFGEEGAIKKTPLIELEGVRDADGNTIEIDPIEYKIRKLTPIKSVKKVLRERIFPLVNLEFEFLDEKIKEDFDFLESGIVRIGFDPNGGCWSMLGMDNFFTKEKFTLNFSWLDAGTIMHEFCHVLGLIHEHQLPLGKPIQWDEPLVYEWAKNVHGWTKEETYINIIKKYEVNQINGIDYDPLSIMHYFFPPQLTLNKKGSTQNLRLAVEDIKFIISVFPGKDIDYRIFYKQIYGKNIEEDSNWLHNLLKIIAGLSLIYILFRIYKNRALAKRPPLYKK